MVPGTCLQFCIQKSFSVPGTAVAGCCDWGIEMWDSRVRLSLLGEDATLGEDQQLLRK